MLTSALRWIRLKIMKRLAIAQCAARTRNRGFPTRWLARNYMISIMEERGYVYIGQGTADEDNFRAYRCRFKP